MQGGSAWRALSLGGGQRRFYACILSCEEGKLAEFISKWLSFSGATLQDADAKGPGPSPSGPLATAPPEHSEPASFPTSDVSPEHLGTSNEPLDAAAEKQSEIGQLMEQLCTWAGDSADRWKRVHHRLLGAYAPAWVLVEARCVLVAWAAAWMSLTKAKRELVRLENRHRVLTRSEQAAESARQADVSF